MITRVCALLPSFLSFTKAACTFLILLRSRWHTHTTVDVAFWVSVLLKLCTWTGVNEKVIHGTCLRLHACGGHCHRYRDHCGKRLLWGKKVGLNPSNEKTEIISKKLGGSNKLSRWSDIIGRKHVLKKLGRILALGGVFEDREWRPLPNLGTWLKVWSKENLSESWSMESSRSSDFKLRQSWPRISGPDNFDN